MGFYSRYIRPLYFSRRFYWTLVAIILLFVLSYRLEFLFPVIKILLILFAILVLLDYRLLFSIRNGVPATRIMPDRFSNGDDNIVELIIRNHYPFQVSVSIIDEIPDQFQNRNFLIMLQMKEESEQRAEYSLRPTERGEYLFHNTNVFIKSPLRLVVKRQISENSQTVRVYPSFQTLRQFELKAYSNTLTETGSRKIRKIGHSMEFEQIKEYVTGDDIRSINWKATARRSALMVNRFTDEKSQPVYCLIDKGRVMKMPFNGMSLLDYAINAALVLTRVALIKQDKAGIISFAEEPGSFIAASGRPAQMNTVIETLYNQETKFLETDYEKLYSLIRTRIPQRSLLIIFSNFESVTGMQRQLPFLRAIARNHLVLMVFFENTELRELTRSESADLESLYIKTIAERFSYEKRLIVKELRNHGIFTILTPPENLTVNTVNKYLELKARQAI